jgi:cysteine-rich repeat protein
MKKLILYTSSVAIAALLVNCGEDADPGVNTVTPGPATSGPGTMTPTNTTPGASSPGVVAPGTGPTATPTDTPTDVTQMPTDVTQMPTDVTQMPTVPEAGGEGGAGGGGSDPVTPGPVESGGMGGGMVDPGPVDTEPECGDGMMEGAEACDDGNMMPGDGCEPDCTVTPVPEAITIAELVPDLDGHLVTTPCGDQPNQDDCAGGGWSINGGQLNVCQGGQLSMDVEYDVGGEPGVVYDVTMHFYGVMEPRQYNQVTRDAMGGSARDEGGMPTPWAWAEAGANYRSLGDNNYNTYEIHVYDNNGQEQMMYFLNSDSGTGHYTMAISYEKTIPIIGGGKVQLIVQDANCRMIKNCGPSGGPGDQCGNLARSIDISAADPQPAANALQQPGLGNPPQHSGQWWLIDVTNVQEAAAQ